MNAVAALVTFAAGLGGILLGGLLARRNEKQAHGDRLLVEALNDAITAIADVAGGKAGDAQRRYASATSRIALHASPSLVATFRCFQDDATTITADGRARLLAAIKEARRELGHGDAQDDDIAVLLFGNTTPGAARRPPRGR